MTGGSACIAPVISLCAAFLIVSVVSGALLLPTGRVADTRGRRPVVIVGLLVGAAGFVLLPTLPAIADMRCRRAMPRSFSMPKARISSARWRA